MWRSWLDLFLVLKRRTIIFLVDQIRIIINLKRTYHLRINYAFFEVLIILWFKDLILEDLLLFAEEASYVHRFMVLKVDFVFILLIGKTLCKSFSDDVGIRLWGFFFFLRFVWVDRLLSELLLFLLPFNSIFRLFILKFP